MERSRNPYPANNNILDLVNIFQIWNQVVKIASEFFFPVVSKVWKLHESSKLEASSRKCRFYERLIGLHLCNGSESYAIWLQFILKKLRVLYRSGTVHNKHLDYTSRPGQLSKVIPDLLSLAFEYILPKTRKSIIATTVMAYRADYNLPKSSIKSSEDVQPWCSGDINYNRMQFRNSEMVKLSISLNKHHMSR